MKATNDNINESKTGGYFHTYKNCFQISFARKLLLFLCKIYLYALVIKKIQLKKSKILYLRKIKNKSK